MPHVNKNAETNNTLCLVLFQVVPIAFIFVVIYGGLLILLVVKDQVVHITFRLRMGKLETGFKSI